jgi:DNA modification methylase
MGSSLQSLTDLTPDPQNANKGTPRGAQMVEDSLRQYGAGRSILVDKHGTVIAGNKTLEAAVSIGLEDAIVVQTDGRRLVVVQRTDLDLATDAAAMELGIVDNRAAELGLSWDAPVLQSLAASGADLSRLFTTDELAALLAQQMPPVNGLTDADAVPEARATSIKPGDLFELGGHRLLCGDSTNGDDVSRLMASQRAGLCFTSPPYADAREYQGGDMDPLHLSGFLGHYPADIYVVNLGLIRKDGALVTYWDEYITAAHAAGLKLLSWNVWDRGIAKSVAQKTAMFPIEHEWILVFGMDRQRLRPTVPNPGAGGIRKPTNRQKDGTITKASAKVVRDHREIGTVYRGGVVHRSDDHPAMFPVEFAETYIAACTDVGGVVSEPFSGSGTTMIACEQLGRCCRAMELAPQYVQVAIDRWEAFTGKKAVKADGR